MPHILPTDPPQEGQSRVGALGLRGISWFIPDRPRKQVELLRTRLYVVLSLLVSANAGLFSVLHHVHHLPGTSRMVIGVLICICASSLTFPFLLRASVPLHVLGPVFMVFFQTALVAIMCYDGGLSSGAVFWVATAPLAAALIGGERLAWAMAAVSVVTGGTFYAASTVNIVFSRALSPADADLHYVLNFVCAVVLVAVLAALYEGPMRRHFRTLSTQLATTNAELQAELAERRYAQAAAEAGNRAKDALLSNMSHEFRTPLTAILGFTDVLLGEVDEAHRSFLESVDRGAKRLLSTLNGVLELAWIESSDAMLTRVPVDLGKLVDQAVEAVRPQAQARGLQVHVDAESAMASADASALARVVWALLDNAVRFTDEGSVDVSVRDTPSGPFIQIRDTGVGMSPDLIPLAIEPFRQVSEGDGRLHEGSGLGLTVAARLTERMGGTIAVESAPLRGTTVSLSLPGIQLPHGLSPSSDAWIARPADKDLEPPLPGRPPVNPAIVREAKSEAM